MAKQWTGERLETFITGESMLEHLHRYAIALPLVKNKKALDIACGEGYGTNLLAQQASHVTGIDIDNKVLEAAAKKYTASNISFIQGSVLKIPVKENSFDIITCFETLEHTDDHDLLMSELNRVLKPGGVLLLSTPDRSVYSDKTGYKNPFHKKELYRQEFKALVNRSFKNMDLFLQDSMAGSVILKEHDSSVADISSGDYQNIYSTPLPGKYMIAIASDETLPEISPGIFQAMRSIDEMIFEAAHAVKRTTTYRFGHTLLFPFKFIRSIFIK